MPRLQPLDPDDPDLDPVAAAILQGARAADGRDLNVLCAMAQHPAALAGLSQFAVPVYHGNSLPPHERELAYLATSVKNDCFY